MNGRMIEYINHKRKEVSEESFPVESFLADFRQAFQMYKVSMIIRESVGKPKLFENIFENDGF